MSLLSDAMEPFVMMDKTSTSDGYGGISVKWKNGAEFEAAIDLPDSELAVIADKITERINCNVTTRRAVSLSMNDYIKRIRDGKFFHILQSGEDRGAPKMSGIDARPHKAEVIETLPDGRSNG